MPERNAGARRTSGKRTETVSASTLRRHRRLQPVETPEEYARVRSAYEAHTRDYLRRLGAWAKTERKAAHESLEGMDKLLKRDGLLWSYRTIREIESYALLPDDEPLPKVNYLVMRWLARHYGAPIDRLERYLMGGEYPTVGRMEGELARMVAQLTPDQVDAMLRFGWFLAQEDMHFTASVTPAAMTAAASNGRHAIPPLAPPIAPSLASRVAVEQIRATMTDAAEAQRQREEQDAARATERAADGRASGGA